MWCMWCINPRVMKGLVYWVCERWGENNDPRVWTSIDSPCEEVPRHPKKTL
jgi:hypothetical protein